MAQHLEPLLPDHHYHIYNHANGNDNLFKVEANYYFFIEKYVKYILPIADTFAYCLLPNHFHFFIRIHSNSPVFENSEDISEYCSQQFSNLFNGYTQAYNKRYERKGSLFIPRFRRKSVNTPDYFIQLIKYIHLNPVHHGFVMQPDDWKFSSYHSYLFNKTSKVNYKEGLEWFGDRNNFMNVHQTAISEKFILDMEL